jgi:hypothetical protein
LILLVSDISSIVGVILGDVRIIYASVVASLFTFVVMLFFRRFKVR